jgi:hypothetical protein
MCDKELFHSNSTSDSTSGNKKKMRVYEGHPFKTMWFVLQNTVSENI